MSDNSDVDPTPASLQEVQQLTRSAIARQVLLNEMPPDQYESVISVTHALIERRFANLQNVVNVRSGGINVNPFLMLAMAPAYNIFSPYEVAEYTQNAKLPHGDSTAFGKFVEARIFPIFHVSLPPEKAADPDLYSPIDAELTIEGTRYLATWKSGPWTMNQDHAHQMSEKFPLIHEQTGLPIVLGIFYGTTTRLNNKPALVARANPGYFHVLVGKELWEFVTGVRDAHLTVLKAIREAQARFSGEHGGKTFFEHLIESRLKLAQSFREEFELAGSEEDMWEQIFKKSF